MKKYLILILFFYLIALFQTSFLVHFNFFPFLPNLILISQILITVFENPKENLALFTSFLAGFFWDIFSENPLGLGIIISFSLSFLIKIILRQYVRIPGLSRF